MSHASPRRYLQIFLILTVLTALEIGLVYVPGLGKGLLVAGLIGLAVVKATLVGLFFMHLGSETRALKLSVLVPLLMPAAFAATLIAEAAWRLL